MMTTRQADFDRGILLAAACSALISAYRYHHIAYSSSLERIFKPTIVYSSAVVLLLVALSIGTALTLQSIDPKDVMAPSDHYTV